MTVKKLQKLAIEGQIRSFLLLGKSQGNEQVTLINWIRTNCRIVPSNNWEDTKSKIGGRSGFGNSFMKLYEYVKNDSLG